MVRVPRVSFEVFPPADAAGARQLRETLAQLAGLEPAFVSVTQGAGGSTADRTPHWVRILRSENRLAVVPHLTCASGSRAAVLGLAAEYGRQGIRSLVVLRGDAPPAAGGTVAADHFRFAADLVAALTDVGEFDLSVAAYPEGHPESGSLAEDIAHLGQKLAAGARRAITQFCFDTETWLRFRDRCVAAGIRAPLVPGIMPIVNFPQLQRFAQRCGASVPDSLAARFAALGEDSAAQHELAAEVAIAQVERLVRHGVDALHFYTLNRAELTLRICAATGLAPDQRRRFG